MISHHNKHVDAVADGPRAVQLLVHELLEVDKTIKVI